MFPGLIDLGSLPGLFAVAFLDLAPDLMEILKILAILAQDSHEVLSGNAVANWVVLGQGLQVHLQAWDQGAVAEDVKLNPSLAVNLQNL